jgi:hypothetical protein
MRFKKVYGYYFHDCRWIKVNYVKRDKRMLIFVGDVIKPRQDRFRIFPLIHAGRLDKFRVNSV